MTLVSKRLPILLAVLVGVAMALTAWSLLPSSVYADDGDLADITLDGCDVAGDDYYLLLNSKSQDDMITLDDLGVRVYAENGDEVTDNCNLELYVLLWNEEREEDVPVPVEGTRFGINDSDKGGGISEYILKAFAKDDSGYNGEIEVGFTLADRHTLNWICSSIDFDNYVKKTGWRMHDWFWFREGTQENPLVLDPQVTGECGAQALTAGTDYEVTYYYRNDNMFEPVGYEDLLGDMVVDEVSGLPVQPTEPGEYYVVIEGKGSYYGMNLWPIDIKASNTIVFQGDGDELWSDEDKEYLLQFPAGVEGTKKVEVGFWDDEEQEWYDRIPANGRYYEFDSETSTLTLHGTAIVDEYGTPDFPMTLYATITNASGKTLADGFEDVYLKWAEYDYRNMPNEQDDLLPGWGGWIDKEINAFIRNAKYPDGKNFDLPIIDVSIEDPDDVLELTDEGDHWSYEAKKFGEATIQLKYYDYDYDPDDDDLNDPKIAEIHVTVSDTVYDLDMWSKNGFRSGLPGSRLTLCAQARKEMLVPNYDDPEHPNQENTTEGLTYEWSITEGEEYATITPNAKDPSKAVLKFKDMPKGWDEMFEPVKVKVVVRDSKSDEPNLERKDWEEDFSVESEFYQICPTTIDSDLEVGQTLEFKPEVRHYRYGKKNYTIVEDVEYTWNDLDDTVIDVDEENGTITRLNGDDTWFNLDADFDDGHAWQDYHLNGKDYQLEFWFWDASVYDDSTLTISPRIRDAVSLSDDQYQIDYEVKSCHYDEDAGEDIIEDLPDGAEDIYNVENNIITFDGAKMAEAGLSELRVSAVLTVNGERYGSDEPEEFKVILRTSCTTRGRAHHWIEGEFKKPTLKEVGYKVKVCMGELFLDGCGELLVEEIPKLIDIDKATVTAVKDQGYTGKALKPALTVKYNGTALKAGTDYKVTYEDNTKIGTATAILEGIGKYGGSKDDVTFQIVKGTNPMTVKTKPVTLKAKDVKKKNQTIKTTAAFAVSKAQGTVTYAKKSGDAKITIAKNGTITVKKGLKKGKYKFVVNVKAAGNSNYKALTKAVTVNITIK